MENQFGQDILCVPYGHTPFSLPSLARSASFKDAVITEDFRFDPSTVKDHFVRGCFISYLRTSYDLFPKDCSLSCPDSSLPTPVLHRIWGYHGEPNYSNGGIPRRSKLILLTLFFEFRFIYSLRQGNYTVSNIIRDMYKEVPAMMASMLGSRFSTIEKLDFLRYGPDTVGLTKVAEVRSLHTLPASSRSNQPRQLTRWIDKFFLPKGNMFTYKNHWQRENGSAKINWEDPRIREFVPEEVNAVRSYMDMGIVEANLREMGKVRDTNFICSLSLT